MQVRLQHLLFAALLISLVSLAYGVNYVYYSDVETTRFGERIKFWHSDTLCGPVRSNDQIAIMQDPYYCDLVISSEADFWRGPGYNPGFTTDYPPVFNAPRLEMPTTVPWIRQQAATQGLYFSQGDTMQARVHLEGDHMLVSWARLGMSFDSSEVSSHALPDSSVVFFDSPIVNLWGTVSGNLIMGVSGRAGLEDNLLYASSNPANGRPADNHAEKFALVAEGEIKVLNTYANGRENSGGRGLNQTNLDSSSILLNGLYFVLGESFTFDQQNDLDSGYVYQNPTGTPHMDDRGTVYLWGGLAQHRRGYMHRSANGSTGYLKQYRYDEQLRYWHVGVFEGRENLIQPSSVSFGEVAIGSTGRQWVTMSNDFVPVRIDSVVAPAPFFVQTNGDTLMWQRTMPVYFIPTEPGEVSDTIHLYIDYYHRWYSIPVSGTGTGEPNAVSDPILHPSSVILSSSPNPFNPSTRIAFTLPQAGMVTLKVYDVAGRLVATLLDQKTAAGEHAVMFDGANLPSGLYLARLETAQHSLTQKLLLVK
ncbi:MAG TPA: T9SS type A sorting domain-containing protein [bacterium]|jgi:hypothetical protein